MSEFSLISAVPNFHEPNRITHAPAITAAKYPIGTRRKRISRRTTTRASQPLVLVQSVIAIARSAMRSRADSFSVALLSWPQAARMSRPRGVRTGDE